jgi:hypothetical protein
MTRGRGEVVAAARRVKDASRRQGKRTLAGVWARRLRAVNRSSSRPVVGEAPVAVSLTSFGRRVEDVALAIESIGAGTIRPSRLVLWLDDPALMDSLPDSLHRLRERGLEVALAENWGPHTKYYPYVVGCAEHRLPLVTADDDILYPPWWLTGLLREHTAMPDAVHCYRANVVRLAGEALAPYQQWPRCNDRVADVARFATGVSGVIYPPAMLDELRRRATGFLDTAPRADDVWLHWVALRSGTPVRQVSRTPRHWPVIPHSQVTGLVQGNVHEGGNDAQIAALYDHDDVDRLRRALDARD